VIDVNNTAQFAETLLKVNFNTHIYMCIDIHRIDPIFIQDSNIREFVLWMTIRSKERKVNELHFVNIFSLLETSLE
jgi:hypothetical protein